MFKPLPDRPDFEITGDKQPVATLFMPTHNRHNYIAQSLRSALNQNGIVLEILILDDASTDTTPEIVLETLRQHPASHHTIKFWKGRQVRGNDITATLIDKATCDFCIAQHDDDISAPHRAKTLYQTYLEKGATVVSSARNIIDEHGRSISVEDEVLPSGFILPENIIHSEQTGTYISGAFLAFDRVKLRAFPRLDTAYLTYGHDRLTSFRGTLLGGFYYLSEALLDYRDHPEQRSKKQKNYHSLATSQLATLTTRLTLSLAMERDLKHLLANAAKPPENASIIHETILQYREHLLNKYITRHEELFRQGYRQLWVEESIYNQLQLEYQQARFWRRGRWRILTIWLQMLRRLFPRH